MSNGEVSWSRKPAETQGSAHPDYKENLNHSNTFIKRVENSLHEGMRTYIADSQHLVSSIFMITFSPPRTAKKGNYAAPISLHQSRSTFNKQVEAVFNCYIKEASDFWKKYQDSQQLNFLNKNY